MVDKKVIEAVETLLNAFLPVTQIQKEIVIKPQENKVPRMRTIDETYHYIKEHDNKSHVTKPNLVNLARKKKLLVKMGARNYIDINKLDVLFSGDEEEEFQMGVIRPIKE